MEITNETIRADIAGYKQRIREAENKLAALPGGYLPYPEYIKREKQIKFLTEEIQHVRKLLALAESTLIEAATDK